MESQEASLEHERDFNTKYDALIDSTSSSTSSMSWRALNRQKSAPGRMKGPGGEERNMLLQRSHSKSRKHGVSLKNTWKYVQRELSNENRVVADAFIDSNKNQPQYAKRDYNDDLLVRARLRLLRGVDSLQIRLLGLAILLADIIFIIIELVPYKYSERADAALQILDLIVSAYFCIEVSIRIIGLGWVYFRRWFEVLDMIIVILSTLLSVVYILLADGDITGKNHLILLRAIRLVIIGRVFRVFFWARIVYEQNGIQRFFRNKISQNKRRYIDMEFDLDLTYVTDRVIAMSFPSSGSESLYRNSIRDVGEFLDKNHFGHYRVYNLCSEREYDTSYFHNQVQRILIDDHNVPRFTDLVDFCEDVYTWMEANPENVIVVHCKGGKGRTGTMVSAWLVRSGLFLGAGESLAYFKSRRTDETRGAKSQGVQTLTVGKGDGTDWNFEIIRMNKSVFEYDKNTEEVELNKDVAEDVMEFTFSEADSLLLVDDVRFKFYCSTRSIPTGNDKCNFYFWFHTTFIEENRLTLDRSEVDNLHKSRIQRYYPDYFFIDLQFHVH